ncbi:hypothetical protein DB32_006019 [Sandaracinus amylolyticus]|uniref:Uncharacterized protein n=2 Tax=Sandaracinus amylolyticus TaxID=927083 RepID=A0A0F6YL35_9BACT|nr:hypothetical protein DB32_006019 [Sandaracinus amylolyticus]
MLREGSRVKHVAEKLGVSVTTVKRWQAAAKLGEQVKAEVETEEQARLRVLEEARTKLAKEVGDAVQTVIDVMHYTAADALDVNEGDVKPSEFARADSRVAKVRLQAALAVLDRAGLPKVNVLEHGGDALSLLTDHLNRALAQDVDET